MESELLEKICNQVYSKYPEVAGAQPKVQSQGEGYLLVFKSSARASTGINLQRIIRVVASATGKIIKVSSSK